MRIRSAVLGCVLLAAPAGAHQPWPEPGRLVGVSVEVEGVAAPLYLAPDGSGRFYLEARRGGRYTIRLANRTGERLAVLMAVDGLNVLSGERQPPGTRGRMYVLDPWGSAEVQGWRTSLDDVRRFTFVDEQRSYAARSGKANARMGWIELAVYRERRVTRHEPGISQEGRNRDRDGREEDERAQGKAQPPPAAAPEDRAAESSKEAYGGARRDSYPGTGWGEQTHDPVVVVDFQPESQPAERVTLRYEYASALRALGILPTRLGRDRLRERERGEGFAQPPKW